MRLELINYQGDSLLLTDNKYVFLTNIDGHTSANASISSVVIGGIDGDSVNNAQAEPRSIVLDLRIKSTMNVEDAKRAVLSVVKLKQECSLIWTQNSRTTKISGIVEGVEMPRWENAVTMQVTLHCEQPFWEDIDYIIQEIGDAIGLHYFAADENDMLYFPEAGIPFGEYNSLRIREFNNKGDVSVGMEIEIVALGTVTNPIIYDADGNFFGVGYGTGSKQVTMTSGDVIKITTFKGNKTVKMNGTSILGRIKPQSMWLQLRTGKNTFSISSDDDDLNNMTFSLIFKQRYI